MALDRIAGRLSLSAVAAGVLLAQASQGQQLIGYVNTKDADVTGASDVLDGQAVLTRAASVTAHEHTAPITLGRGGTVRVCQTSALHVTENQSGDVSAPLLFSLDRGSIEIQMNTTVNDAIMTPDLRFAIANKGPLDLRIRVARNGDTCVENRGPAAPTLNISDAFGESMYQVAAGQHVMFEHGSLHEVVDKEPYPCGCPPEQGMSVADALLASGGGAKPALPGVSPAAKAPVVTATVPPAAAVPAPAPTASSPAAPVAAPAPAAVAAAAPAPAPVLVTAPPLPPVPAADHLAAPEPAPPQTVAVAEKPLPPQVAQAQQQAELAVQEQAAAAAAMRAAEERHPFPMAVSEGLAAPPEPEQAAGAPRVQITDTLSYNAKLPDGSVPAAEKTSQGTKSDPQPPTAPQVAPTKTAPAPKKGLLRGMGRFFKRLFGG